MRSIITVLSLALSAFTVGVASTPMGSAMNSLFLSNNDDSYLSSHQEGTIIDRLRGDRRFSRFVEVLSHERGLKDDLENRDKKATVFAPTNEAFKHMEEELKRNKGEKLDMRDILRYHIVPDTVIDADSMTQGRLIHTDLRLRKLNDRHQRIRVFRFHGDTWLNMRARVVESDLEAENGRIHAIDRILTPPHNVREMLYMLPTEFSTFLAAAERTGVSKRLAEENGLSVFAPGNEAWTRLGFENLRHLFSCAGQRTRHECHGHDDLKNILEYLMGRDVAYTTDVMEKGEIRMKTLHGDKELLIEAKERKRGGGSWFDRNEKDEKDVRRYVFLINNGEARVQFTDGIAENGVIQMIDDVIVPDDVKLPHDRY